MPRIICDQSPMFQSTRPARGATSQTTPQKSVLRFNPRAPRGARQFTGQNKDAAVVSIHAPREGRDVAR